MSIVSDNFSICNWPPARKFTRSEVLKLIRLYKRNPCLWNVKSKDYTRTSLKKKAYEEMAETFNVSIIEIKRKIRSIRNTYLIEKKKVDESKKSGYLGDIYEPKLAWFEEMTFLDESILMRRKILPSAVMDEPQKIVNPSHAQDQPRKEQPIISEVKTRRILQKNKTKKSNKHKTLKKIFKYIKQEEDDCFTGFGKSIALQLRSLPELEAYQAMREIQAITSAYAINSFSRGNDITTSTSTDRP